MKNFWLNIRPLLYTLAGVYSGLAAAAPMPTGTANLLTMEIHNGDYLKHIETPPPEQTLNTMMFSKSMSNEGTLRYNAIQDAKEQRHNYGLEKMSDQLRYNSENKSLTDWTMHRLLDDNLRTPVRRFVVRTVKDSLRGGGSNSGSAPADAKAGDAQSTGKNASQTSAATTTSDSNSGFSFPQMYRTVETFYNNGLMLDQHTLMRFQYDVPGGTMDLGIKGAFVDTTLNYYVTPLNFSATGGGFGGNTANPERAALSISKNLNELGLSTAMHYGLMSRSLNYGVNKTVVGPLSAAVSQAHNLADSSKDETTYRVNFGMIF